jgi:hypothetical protein
MVTLVFVAFVAGVTLQDIFEEKKYMYDNMHIWAWLPVRIYDIV